jgi:hypothetical protein
MGIITTSFDQTTKSETSSTGKQSALQQYLNIPTNDGTFRTTFRWKPKGDFKITANNRRFG